jgi:hypothetical protein
VDLVDLGTPNSVHAEQAIAALEAGNHVACEKPLADTLEDAEAMAAEASDAHTFVWYNDRRVPAVALAHQVVASGALGGIYPGLGDRGASATSARALVQGGGIRWCGRLRQVRSGPPARLGRARRVRR